MIQFRGLDKKHLFIGWVMGICLLISFPSCSKKKETPHDAPNIAGENTIEPYEEATPPSTAPVFRWDLSKPGTLYQYTYDQDVRSRNTPENKLNVVSGSMTQEMTVRGILEIRIRKNRTADLILKDMNALVSMDTGKEKSEPVAQPIPDMTIEGLKEDGTGISGNNGQDMLIKTLFPLPAQPLRVGESIDIPEKIPFITTEKELEITGHTRITLSRYVKIGNRTCARLDVETDISEITVPPNLKGKYKAWTRGNATFYFDVADRIFVSGETHVEMAYDIETPATTAKDKQTPDQSGNDRITMKSDNVVRVTLIE